MFRSGAGSEEPEQSHRELDADLVGNGESMRALRREIRAVAALHSTLLVCGETGVGKGVAARAVHRLSPRHRAPFVHVDCAALSPNIIESELFGHERGAFTGAVGARIGRFELARDGTVFLDEIGELEPRLQSKLLRVLQDREFERIGGDRTLAMRARVLAATSRELEREVREGRFRADLFFRIDVVRLSIPPLRDRSVDIPALAEAGFARLSRRLGLAAPSLSPSGLERLVEHTWPGNVRELLNVLERLLVRHPGHRIGIREVAAALGDGRSWIGSPPREPTEASADCTPERIAAALRAAGGNVSRAARALGMSRTTLRRRLEEHGITRAGPKP